MIDVTAAIAGVAAVPVRVPLTARLGDRVEGQRRARARSLSHARAPGLTSREQLLQARGRREHGEVPLVAHPLRGGRHRADGRPRSARRRRSPAGRRPRRPRASTGRGGRARSPASRPPRRPRGSRRRAQPGRVEHVGARRARRPAGARSCRRGPGCRGSGSRPGAVSVNGKSSAARRLDRRRDPLGRLLELVDPRRRGS